MASPPISKGYSAKLSSLAITVEIRETGWSYSIQREGKEIARHIPCWLWNQTDELAKIEAVERALELLGRQADPAVVSNALEWRPYGPGHHE